MQRIGLNAYRFSIAWSRLLPAGRGEVNPEGVDFYRELGERLVAAGITPVATLYHWDLPQALQDEGGWLNPASPEWFADYAAVAKEHLGDLISTWSTFNEPWCTAFLGYSVGEHAPGMTDPGSAYVVAHNLIVAHHLAVARMRAIEPRTEDRIGIVLNMNPAYPVDDTPEAREAADAVDAIQNRLFLDAAFHGVYPELVRRLHHRYGVADRIDEDQLAAVRQDMDYLGLNYYDILRVAYDVDAPPTAHWPGADGARLVKTSGEPTAMGWGVAPEGLTMVLERMGKEYPDTPLYVCENGVAYPDTVGPDGSIDDPKRIAYLEAHIAAVATAIEHGADVRGYFIWSLLDNFEWTWGYRIRFGLVRVDPDTLDRTIKRSGYWYRDFIRSTRV
jgi:beta-glucosidase